MGASNIMKVKTLLFLLVAFFIVGVLVGCVLFMLFQSYVFIIALLGVITFISKLPPLVANAIKQSEEKEKSVF